MNHVKSEHDIMGKTKIQLLYLLNPNFIALFALHVLCNTKNVINLEYSKIYLNYIKNKR